MTKHTYPACANKPGTREAIDAFLARTAWVEADTNPKENRK